MTSHPSERTGAAIRKLRLARGWTLAELSDQTGIPLSTLSRVELGQNSLNSDKLIRLCRALDVDLQGLMTRETEGAPPATGRRSVVRAGEGAPFRVAGGEGRVGAADLLQKAFTPVVMEVQAAGPAGHGPMASLPGEAYLLVLRGGVVMHSPLYAPLALSRGDGVYFDGRAGFALTGAGQGPSQVLLVAAGDGLSGA